MEDEDERFWKARRNITLPKLKFMEGEPFQQKYHHADWRDPWNLRNLYTTICALVSRFGSKKNAERSGPGPTTPS